jgi:hypothetical protein
MTPQRMPAMTAPASPSPTPAATASPTTAQATITVTFRVVSQWAAGFEAEITVVNRAPSPISGWQIVVALPYDQFTAVSDNAAGYASHHILLLHPASYYANSVPAYGTLSVFFTAYGTRITPELCAFNDTVCR